MDEHSGMPEPERRDALRDLQSRVESAIEDVRPKIRKAMEELEARVDEALADMKPRAQSAMREVQPKVDQFVADVQPRLDGLLEKLQQAVATTAEYGRSPPAPYTSARGHDKFTITARPHKTASALTGPLHRPSENAPRAAALGGASRPRIRFHNRGAVTSR